MSAHDARPRLDGDRWRARFVGLVGAILVGASEWFPDLAVFGLVMLLASLPLTGIAARARRTRRATGPSTGN